MRGTRSLIRLRGLFFLTLLVCSAGFAAAQPKPAGAVLKIKVEASDFDRQLLFDKLNANGFRSGAKFVLADQDFDYRIVFSVNHNSVNANQRQVNASGANAQVFDPQGRQLFELDRQARFTGSGAANAVAKDIVVRLLKLKPTRKTE